jgi:hypothetical protein
MAYCHVNALLNYIKTIAYRISIVIFDLERVGKVRVHVGIVNDEVYLLYWTVELFAVKPRPLYEKTGWTHCPQARQLHFDFRDVTKCTSISVIAE